MLRRLGLVALLVSATACLGSTMRVDQTLPTTFADLTAIKTLEVMTQGGAVLARGTFSEGSNSTGKSQRIATLTSLENNAPRGSATIDIDRTSGLSDEEITVRLEQLPYPESCRLMADGHELTIFSTTTKGRLEFRLSRRVTLPSGRRP